MSEGGVAQIQGTVAHAQHWEVAVLSSDLAPGVGAPTSRRKRAEGLHLRTGDASDTWFSGCGTQTRTGGVPKTVRKSSTAAATAVKPLGRATAQRDLPG